MFLVLYNIYVNSLVYVQYSRLFSNQIFSRYTVPSISIIFMLIFVCTRVVIGDGISGALPIILKTCSNMVTMGVADQYTFYKCGKKLYSYIFQYF